MGIGVRISRIVREKLLYWVLFFFWLNLGSGMYIWRFGAENGFGHIWTIFSSARSLLYLKAFECGYGRDVWVSWS